MWKEGRADDQVTDDERRQWKRARARRARTEALAALVMLGFAKTAAEKALRGLVRERPDAPVEELVRLALKML